MVKSNISCTDDGARAMRAPPPWWPHLACITSSWEEVIYPCPGPGRWTVTMRNGVSDMMAKETASIMSEKPGPEVAVMALTPAQDAPMREQADEISSSIWMNRTPTWGHRSAAFSIL